MGGKSQPDMSGAAIAQGEANREVIRDQTFANRPTQFTPFGSTEWNPYSVVDPATGQATTAWQQVTSLTPELQDILNKQIAIQSGRADIAGQLTGRLGSEFGQPMNWEGLAPMGEVPTAQFTMPEGQISDPYQTRLAAEDAVFNQAMSRLQPQFEGNRQAMEIKLRNQGLGPEDQAYQSQMAALAQQENDATNQAIWSATGAGRQEAGQMFNQQLGLNRNDFDQAFRSNQANFGQAMQQSAYANQIRQQQLTEAMQRRGFSLNEINALMSGQQVGLPQMPGFQGASAAQAAPVYQAAADQASIDAAANPWNALASLGGTALGAAGAAGGFGNLF